MASTTYTTIQGDAWDLMAWKLYGDEKHMKTLIEANWSLINTLVFSAGTELVVPDITENPASTLPFWRTSS